MERLIDFYKRDGYLHHAYFLVGDKEVILPKLIDFFEKRVGLNTSGNPDFQQMEFRTLTIENARALADAQERVAFAKGSSRPMKVFIIQADFITSEAQNALLKIFEEPTRDTHFFIISPQDHILPTLRSRMQIIKSEIMPRACLGNMARHALGIVNLKMKERLEMVKEITEAISEVKSNQNSLIVRSSEDGFREERSKQDAIDLVNQIEMELYQNGVEKSFDSLKICEQARISLYDRGAPVKMILENLILSI